MKIKCKVITRSSRNEVVGLDGLHKLDLNFKKKSDDDLPLLKIYLTAVPINGKANKELIKLLSKELKISKSMVVIIKGEKKSEKIIEIYD
ncbi:DUF167 domain-containing protein [Candidatus Parcubacteria bacterium]|nr:DUF167 domain-containing protein [Candidatus Parcubacteria bacterium]